jgi:hypothetical protein
MWYIESMNIVNKAALAAALRVSQRTISNKVACGSLPPPVVGKFPQGRMGKPCAEDVPYWDLDACLNAWGRPKA